MNTENGGTAQQARDNTGRSGGIALVWNRYPENVFNHALARHREKNRTPELAEGAKLAVDTKIVGALLREIDSRVQNDCVVRDACCLCKGDLLPEKAPQFSDNIRVDDMLVGDLW